MSRKLIGRFLIVTILMVGFGFTTFAEETENPTTNNTDATETQQQIVPKPEIDRKKTQLQDFRSKMKELLTNKKPIEKPVPPMEGEKPQPLMKDIRGNGTTTNAIKEQKNAERIEKISEKQRKQIGLAINKIADNFEKTLEKIEQIGVKLQERITLMEQKGFDMTESSKLVQDIPAKVTQAKEKVAQMKVELSKAIESEDPRAAFNSMRPLVETTKNVIKETHQSLVSVIVSIKASVKSSAPVPTPTATTTSSETVTE